MMKTIMVKKYKKRTKEKNRIKKGKQKMKHEHY